LQCALKARKDVLSAPSVRNPKKNGDPEVSPLATFDTRLQRVPAYEARYLER
jgi:hypothetical protein